jgi:FGGY-family pentulose kinase
MQGAHFIGVDVGTGSARAGVFDANGRLLGAAKRPITLWHEPGEVVEQSSEQIWQAVCASVREALDEAGLGPAEVGGIGFDATCSFVALGPDGSPVTVSRSGDPARNVMLWMDHRAVAEVEEINAGEHGVLAYVGGRISPEMETPKLLWLKRHLPTSFAQAGHFMDLADFLTFRATGSTTRSICTVTCKWTYLAHEARWDPDYFRAIGLPEMAEEGFARIGTEMVEPGRSLGRGLTARAADELGLSAGTPVGAALIDAHAGGVGTLGSRVPDAAKDLASRLAYVFGASACSMASTAAPTFVSGVWGPYFSAMVPGLWLNEGGQSAAGAAIDHLVTLHPYAPEARARAGALGLSLTAWLDREASARTGGDSAAVLALASRVHVVPEFLGNRSPLADPDARAVIAGLGLEEDEGSLVRLYLAGLMGLGYGLRQLLDRFSAQGIEIGAILASGGAARSPLVARVLADTTGRAVAVPEAPEPVLLGSAMCAAVSAGAQPSLAVAMESMAGSCQVATPAAGAAADGHARRYRAFETLQRAAREVQDL